jgi:hypothetical protein
MARRCAEDAESITRGVVAAGLTVEDQARVVRSRDMATAQRIFDRHPIMHGVGMAVDDVAQARVVMAGDIAHAPAAERGALTEA